MRRCRPAGQLVLLAVVVLLLVATREARAFVTTFGCAGASSCTLAELLAGGAIQVNYTRFENWELEFIDTDGVQPDFTQIVVEGLDAGGVAPGDGVRFVGNGELAVAGADRLDMAIGYTVAEIGAAHEIQGNTLELSSHAVAGSAFITVGEFVADANGTGLGQKEVDSDPVLSDEIDLALGPLPVGVPQLIIESDILLQSGVAGDSAQLDTFEQRFALPEPGSPLMLGSALVGLWALHGLRSRRSAECRRTRRTERGDFA
jgi:hypothetical protein